MILKMNPLMLCILLMSVGHAHDLFGQDTGQRVRVTAEDYVVVGTVTSTSGNGFDINLQDGGSHSVMYRDIARMERSLGIRTYKKRGLLIGFGAGAVVGEFIKKESWSSVRVSSAVGRLRIDPMVDVVLARNRNPGIVVGARVTFRLEDYISDP
ncbi:MAG: hypothetical protein OXD39_00425 [Gemmatimonadetes bacterium]|nr:hypothetical protein [Gemmatimonadota bacterium]